jgi:putative DNA primase/helicase
MLAESILADERSGILSWLLEGLGRFYANNCSFTISERAKANLRETMRDADPIEDFLDSKGYLTYDPNGKVTTADLYEAFRQYCEDNLYHGMNDATFRRRIRDPLQQRGVYATNCVLNHGRKEVRGYVGVRLNMPTSWM